MRRIFCLIGLLVLTFTTLALAQTDQVTLTTYYPAPFGMYQEMRVMGKLGVGTTNPSASFHVDGGSFFSGGGGDVNASGHLTSVDALLASRYLMGLIDFAPDQFSRADVTGSGIITPYNPFVIQLATAGLLALNDPAWQTKIKRPLGRTIFPMCETGACLDGSGYGYGLGAGANPSGTDMYQEAMRISSTGHIGIGTTMPASKIEIIASGATNASSAAHIKNSSGDSLLFVRDDGRIGVGTTNPQARMDIDQDILIYGLTVGRGGGGNNFNLAFGTNALANNVPTPFGGMNNMAIGVEALRYNTSGRWNVGIGVNALRLNTTGNFNTAVGNAALSNNTTGQNNTAVGQGALSSNTTGELNTAIGNSALSYNTTGNKNTAYGNNALRSNTTGSNSTAVGYGALYSNTTGRNTATGHGALYSNTTGNGNTAHGTDTLYDSTTADYNTALGSSALRYNTTGYSNTATGHAALHLNTTGYRNTATGQGALYSNTTGYHNTSHGFDSLVYNTTGYGNTSQGYASLWTNTSGFYNTASGWYALFGSTTGSYNAAYGFEALKSNTSGSYNTAFGSQALHSSTAGSYNTAIGYDAGTNLGSYTNTTAIGNGARVTGSNMIRLGNTAVTLISAQVDITPSSDGRFKKDIKENVPGLDFVTRLRPVTFHWDMSKLNEFTKTPENSVSKEASQAKEDILYTGFIAQDVEQAAQDIGYDFSGVFKPQNVETTLYGLSSSALMAPAVKAIQELKLLNDELSSQNRALENKLELLTREVENLKARLP